ncbi:MAG: dihydroorotate dehydrogenase [Rhodobacterales bacterium]|nr:MAG: dihydroorotate dehydrogenase [Rhodobacterales bacterium]
MTENQDQQLVDECFAAAQQTAPLPSLDLMERIMGDAAALQPAPQRPAPKPLGNWALFWSIIGGWRGAGGVALATLAGIWIGFSQPAGLDMLAESYLNGDEMSYLADLVPDYETELWEG